MENNPKKSKAFIISFILILLLLLIGYYLFTNRDKIFDAKGTTSISKVFAPLLGTSKDKTLKVIDNTGNGNGKTTTTGITGVIITDQNGNRVVIAEAGENIKKGDVLYISGFNKNKDPIVMKAIASDEKKSLVFGVAGEDMLKGAMGSVIIEGILSGVPTNRVEITPWNSNNILYLSDKIYGGMTKNPPFAPNFVVLVGSVIKVDPINGSIQIGNFINNTNMNNVDRSNLNTFNSRLLNNSPDDLNNYWNSIFPVNPPYNHPTDFPFIPFVLPGPDNGLNNAPYVTVTASPNMIKSGETSTISWTANKATSCDAGNGNGTGVTGSFKTAALTKNTSYAVVCTGPAGSGGGNAFVTIVTDSDCASVAKNPSCTNGGYKYPSVTVTTDRDAIKSGESANISWTSTNTTSCNAGVGNGTGVVGSFKTAALTKNTAYTVVCTGANGRVSDNVSISVDDGSGIKGGGKAECSDGIDNDGDGLIDVADPDCHTDKNAANIKSYNPNNFSESSFAFKTECNDGIDNDGDGLIDIKDPNCHEGDNLAKQYLPNNSSESSFVFKTECNDGIDNNNDGLIDIKDPNCHTDKDATNASSYNPNNYSESSIGFKTECNDGIDNDKDGLIDAADPGCHTDKDATNASSYNPNNYSESIFGYQPECSDGIDNDKDGLIDIKDPDCHTDKDATNAKSYNPNNYSESSFGYTTECNDGIDNDGDKLIDIKDSDCHEGNDLTKKYLPTNYSESSFDYNFPFITVKADPMLVKSGDKSKISWTSANTTSCDSGAGNSTGIAGSFETGAITTGKSYTVTCVGPNGKTSGSIFVDIIMDYKLPEITVKANPALVESGKTSTVSWTSKNATKCEANTSTDTTAKTPNQLFKPNDSFVTPPLVANRSFTVTCSGPNGETSGDAFIEILKVDEQIVVKTQCSDGVDNDGDGLIDEKDPNCHTDGDLTKAYVKEHDSESTSPASELENSCTPIDLNPLEFTDEENAKLDELLRKFYLIAPSLKTEDDINITYSEITQYQNFAEHLDTLINQCYTQVDGPLVNGVRTGSTYKDKGGATTRYGNPWYKYSQDQYRGSYIKLPTGGSRGTATSGDATEVFDCKYISGWFTGNGANGKGCDTYNQRLYDIKPASCTTPLVLANVPAAIQRFYRNTPQGTVYKEAIDNKCIWNPGVKVKDLENIFNVW